MAKLQDLIDAKNSQQPVNKNAQDMSKGFNEPSNGILGQALINMFSNPTPTPSDTQSQNYYGGGTVNSFKPPKSPISPYSPIKQQRSMDEIKREVSPMGGPLTVQHLVSPPTPQPVQSTQLAPQSGFQKLRAMFAKGR